jgi:hypothetical protein
MTATDIAVYRPSQIPGMAYGYMLVGQDGQPLSPGPGQNSTAGSGRLRESHEVQVGNSDRPGAGEDAYAYGFADSRVNGVWIVGHNGGSPGYEAQLDLYPDRGDAVVMLTNQDQVLMPALRAGHQAPAEPWR